MISNFKPLLAGKTALITGCNRGIGKYILELFSSQGLKCAITITRTCDDKFIEFCSTLTIKNNIKIININADFLDANSVKKAMKEIYALKIDIDILINNAGIAHGAFLQMTSMKDLRDVFEVNFFSQIAIIQSISKLMLRKGKGSIICMSSIAGFDSYPGYTAYGSSKAAISYAVKTIAQEIAPSGIRINAIAPALTETEMAKQMEKKASEKMVEASAMKRFAKINEIANVALFLASDESSFICGQTIRVDGGM